MLSSVLVSEQVLGKVTRNRSCHHDITLALCQLAGLLNNFISFKCNHSHDILLVFAARFCSQAIVLYLPLDLHDERLIFLVGVLLRGNEVSVRRTSAWCPIFT